MNKNVRVLGFQLQLELDCNEKDEYLIENKYLYQQINKVKKIIKEKKSDIIIFPEMCYLEILDDLFYKLSKNKLIVAGSLYQNGINYTVVFNNRKKYLIKKCNASVAEPMIRNQRKIDTDEFIEKELDNHIFRFKGNDILILNCMEYYQHAYVIARKYPNLFAIICICSNSNPKLFIEETKAIHNHCENLYSFVINCISTYQGKDFGKGYSYIYGPIQNYEREWLKKEGIIMDDHSCSILKLSNEPEYFYGEFINRFSRFGRSDTYENNPRNVEIKKII